MSAHDPVEILLDHDRWATRQIIEACAQLTSEQFSQKFNMGPGSLQATTTHIISATRAWNDTLAQRPQQPRLDQSGTLYTPAQLLPLLESAADELKAQATRLPLDQTVSRTREGVTYTFTRGAVLTHVTTHAMHHRAQCLNMLRQLGVQPLPPSSVTEWTWIADRPS